MFRSRSAQLFSLGLMILAGGLIAGVVWQRNQRQEALPPEYRRLSQVVQRLAAANPLGQPISFSITAGSYAAELAQGRGLCQPDHCDFFAQLDPYRHYDRSWDELMRQAYRLGDIEAWSASSGTVNVSRATFRAYGSHDGWLACTIAHEIAHIKRNHVFAHSYYYNNTLKGKDPKRRDELSFSRGRDQELEADSDSARMMARAGFGTRICLDNLIFLHHSAGDGSATEPDSTHPGYDDRIKAMQRFTQELSRQPGQPGQAGSRSPRQVAPRGTFHDDRSNNLLTFIPTR